MRPCEAGYWLGGSWVKAKSADAEESFKLIYKDKESGIPLERLGPKSNDEAASVGGLVIRARQKDWPACALLPPLYFELTVELELARFQARADLSAAESIY